MRHLIIHNVLLILSGVTLIALMVCCGHGEASRRLAEADALIEERPDSALRILEALDTASLRRERDIRLRDLLLAQACVKLDREDIDTVPLAAAQKYFDARPEEDYRLRSNFYMGYVGYLDSCFISGTGYAADAFLEARDSRDSYWTAKSAELISHIINNCGFPNESLKYDSIAALEYAKAGKTLNSLFSRIDMAKALGSVKRYKEADRIYNDVLKDFGREFPKDTLSRAYALKSAIRIKLLTGVYTEADSLLNKLFRYNPGAYSDATVQSYLAAVEIYKGNYGEAKRILKGARVRSKSLYEDMVNNIAKRKLAEATSDTALLVMSNSEIISNLNKHANFSHGHPVVRILHDKLEHKGIKEISHYKSIISYSIVVLLLFLPFIIELIYALYTRRQNALEEINCLERRLIEADINYKSLLSRYDKKSAEANALKTENKKYSEGLSPAFNESTSIQNLFLESLGSLGGDIQGDYDKATRMKKKAQKLLTSEYTRTLTDAITIANKNLMDKFTGQFPDMSYSNVQFFTLTVGGLSVGAISLLLKENLATVYSRRTRIINVLKSSDSPDKNLFLRKIEKQRKGKQVFP